MTALSEAQHFLSPVLDRTQLLTHHNLPLLDRLALTLPPPSSPSPDPPQSVARKVLTHALHLLHTISAAPIPTSAPAPAATTTTTALENATDNRTLNALLDLLVLEGVYPSLSPGVGIPLSRRARNFVIPTPSRGRGKAAEVEDRRDVALLGGVVGGLLEALGGGGAAARAVRERCLVDVLAGCGELAFGPDAGEEEEEGGGKREAWRRRWWGVVESTQTPALLPPLLSLLHPSTPPPLRTALTGALSNLPMTRPHAVRHIIELFLTNPSLDALSNASRLIGAVPAAATAQQYFEKVCPQLLELLDAPDSTLAGAAGYVLAELLGRKGAVEAVVEREVVAKLVAGMVPGPGREAAKPAAVVVVAAAEEKKPGTATASSAALLALEDAPPLPTRPRFSLVEEILDDDDDDASPATTTATTGETSSSSSSRALIPERTLSQTLTRLSTLLAAHPSPAAPHRLLAPLLPALWALAIFSLASARSTWHARALALLHTHIKTSSSPAAALAALHAHILCAGGQHWRFAPGAEGGVEVRAGAAGVRVEEVEARVDAFVEVLAQAPEDAIAEFFLGALRTWLVDVGGGAGGVEGGGVEAAVGMVARTAVLREVVGRFGGALARRPGQALQVVGGVLGEYRLWKEAGGGAAGAGEEARPSLEGLGRIVGERPAPVRRERERERRRFVGEGEDEDSDDEDLDEETARAQTVTLALSLLSVLVSAPDTKLTAADERLLQTLHPALTFLTTAPNIPDDLSAFALNILSLLTLNHTPPSTTAAAAPASLAQQQKETYALAHSYLRDPLVPVRAHGLHLLRELILAAAPAVNVPATTALLIATLSDTDSYVYLNAVKCLTALTDRHSRTATHALVDAYVDAGEALGLDERLRVGEALLGTVQRRGAALVGDVAAALAAGMVAVVSRRKTRSGGNAAAGAAEFGSDDDDDEDAQDAGEGGDAGAVKERRKRALEAKAAIVAGWAGSGRTEDVRIRASALSILGAAVETNAAGMGARVLHEALDISLLVLTLEGGAEAGILRRAAVVCVGAVLKALVGLGGVEGAGGEGEGELWREEVWAVVRGRVGEVRRVLRYVSGADNDGLVREQAGVVGANLEAVVERWVAGAGGRGGQRGGGIIEVGEGGLGSLRIL